LATVLHALQQI